MKKLGKISKFVISAAVIGSVITAASSAQALTLKKGSTGYNVRTIQTALKSKGYFPRSVSATGYYGSITRRAVMNFQRANGLRVDGIAGPRTLRVMGYGGTGGSISSADNFHGATGVVVASRLNIRSGPSTRYGVVGSLTRGQRVSLSDERNGWYKLKTSVGSRWISGRYISFSR
ncbi:MAG: peptidoglycan-binding protein [Cyanobacteria bacterium P01_A01_bin.84]